MHGESSLASRREVAMDKKGASHTRGPRNELPEATRHDLARRYANGELSIHEVR